MQLQTLLVPTPATEFPPKEVKALEDGASVSIENSLGVISTRNTQLHQTNNSKNLFYN